MSTISRLYNPYYLAQRYANAKKGVSVSAKDIITDVAWKTAGGLTLAPLLYFLTAEDKRILPRKNNPKEIKEYITSKYVSIPSESEPDVYQEIMKEHKESQDNEERPSAFDVFLPKTHGMGFAIPVSAAALVSALFVGSSIMDKMRSRQQVGNEKEKQQDINKEIGRIVESRYRKTRGLEKDAAWKWVEDMKGALSNTKDRGLNALYGIATVGLLIGLAGGWAKGRSLNESVILDKGVQKALASNKVVADTPKIIVPNTYEQYMESSAQRSPQQRRVPVQDIV
jgi:hypothetical protein